MSLGVWLTIKVDTGGEKPHSVELYDGNVTHNLAPMAREAVLYRHLWEPEELGIEKAGDLISPLKVGLSMLREYPEQFKKLNPANGWGNYDGFVIFVAEYLEACIKHPKAIISISK